MEVKIKVEEEVLQEDGSVLFKKSSYNPSPEDSKVGISSDYDLKGKHLIEKSNSHAHKNSDGNPSRKSKANPRATLRSTLSVGRSSKASRTKSLHQGESSHSVLYRPSALDEDERLMKVAGERLDQRLAAPAIKSKPKSSFIILSDHNQTIAAQIKEQENEINDEIELLQTVMEHEDKKSKSNLSGPPSWEKFLSAEVELDPDLLKKHEHHEKKIHITKQMMDDLKGCHPGDQKRQMLFLEEVIAAYHMKDLTSKYGSKGKSGKQYFMEAYDTDTRAEVVGDDDTDAKQPFHKYDSKGKEIFDHAKRQEEAEEVKEDVESVFGSPIAIRSIEVFPGDGGVPSGLSRPVLNDYSEPNFWKSLEKIQIPIEDEDDLKDLPDILSPCPSSKSDTLAEPIATPIEASNVSISKSGVVSEAGSQSVEADPLLDKYLEPTVQDVIQSEYVRKLCQQVQKHLELFNVKDPLAYDLFGKTYEEVRDFTKLPEEDVAEFEAGNWEPSLFLEHEIFDMEPCEKLISRFHIYQKALLSVAEHFETLRPLLAEIKQAYEEVLEKCDKEWKDLDKERIGKLRVKDSYAAYVRSVDQDGDRALMEVKVQAHALSEHVQWQQHTLFSIMGMLWKMRQSLKMQTRLVKKTQVAYKSKVETLAREIVSQQGQSMYESALPGKYTEIMNRFRHIKDPKEVRRILQSARRQLRKAHKQLVVFEADYADTVPRTEFDMYKKKYNTIHTKNQSVIQKCDELKAEIARMKENIAKMNADMYDEVGLDMETGEKPILYLEPLGIDQSVPVYLRYGQRVVDLKYTSQEAVALIKDIWKNRVDLLNLCRRVKKAHDDEQEGVGSYPDDLQYDMPEIAPFPNFVAEYFKNKCDLEEGSMEFSYNLVTACRRNQDDSELTQFLGVLEGTVNEAVYHLFQLELARINELIIDKANESKDNKGYLGFGDFCKYLQEIFRNKSEEAFKELGKVAQYVSGARGDWAMVPVTIFFEKADSNVSDNDFVKLLHTQFEQERKQYIHEIYTELLMELGISEKLLEHTDDPAWLTDVSMHIFYAAVTSIDPEITSEGVATYLAWVFLGMTALPGIVTLGTKLVDFLKERAHMAYYELEKYDEDQDLEFEDCVRQLKEYDEDESTMDKLDMKKRRLQTKKLKYASLRQVTDRLNSGPIIRHGKRPNVVNAMTMNTEYSQGPSESDLEDESHEHRHHHHHRDHEEEQEHGHRHHHHHHKSQKSERKTKRKSETKSHVSVNAKPEP